MRWRHQVGLPASVRDVLVLDRGERVLAAAAVSAAPGTALQHAVATDLALHVPGSGGLERIRYESILKVSWDQDSSTLVLVRPEPAGQLDLPLAEPGFLPETVRERVQSTIVFSQHVPLDGVRGIMLSARRAPGASQARWTMAFDAGLDATDPSLRARAAQALDEVRAQTGI
ncbi:MAG: hypothetical protein L0Y54_19840 [Sporichthyaceae bacterium]|nr:hypothetical protein [Sporichthyaceae bacterium]